MRLPAHAVAAALCIAVPAGTFAAEPAENQPKVQTFTSNSIEIAFADWGEGEAVVLHQGFGGRLSNWRPMRSAILKAGYRVIAMDARGHGQSGKPHDVQSYGVEMADDVVRLLDHLGIRRAHIVGLVTGIRKGTRAEAERA